MLLNLLNHFIKAILLGSMIFLVSCAHHEMKIESENSKNVVEVSVDVPKQNSYTDPFTLSGTIKSHQVVKIASKVMLQIVDVTVEEGSPVKSGQVLVMLDDREARINMARVESQGIALNAQREELNEKLQELKNRVEILFKEQVAYISQSELAQNNLERYKKLLEKEVVTQEEFDTVKTKFDVANSIVEKSQVEYKLLMTQKKQLDAKYQQLLAQIEQNKASMADAIVNKSYTQIITPINGFVASKLVEVGDMAVPGKTLLTLENPVALYLEVNVDEAQAYIFKPGSKVEVYVDALQQKTVPGKVREIIPSADPTSHTFKVKIDLKSEKVLHSGMYARVILLMGGENLFVPRTAVVTQGQIKGVFVVDTKNIARFKIIKPGQDIQGFIQVLSGLTDTDKVITSNLENIHDGTKVKILGEK